MSSLRLRRQPHTLNLRADETLDEFGIPLAHPMEQAHPVKHTHYSGLSNSFEDFSGAWQQPPYNQDFVYGDQSTINQYP